MSKRLSVQDLALIQMVNQHINTFIEQIEQGNAPNPSKLLQIEQELQSLVKNENIPQEIKKKLHIALKRMIREGESSLFDLASLYDIQEEIRQALAQGEWDHR